MNVKYYVELNWEPGMKGAEVTILDDAGNKVTYQAEELMQLEDLKNRIAELENENRELDKRAEIQFEENWEAQGEISNLENENKALERRLELEREETDLYEKNIDIRLRNQVEETKEAVAKVKELMTHIEHLEESMQKLQGKVRWKDASLTEKTIQLNKHDNLVDDLMKVVNILVDK